jgi:hypothetical protein
MVFKEILITTKQLVERDLYHNDIKPGNICYTFQNNELNIFLIDLDTMDFKKRTSCT